MIRRSLFLPVLSLLVVSLAAVLVLAGVRASRPEIDDAAAPDGSTSPQVEWAQTPLPLECGETPTVQDRIAVDDAGVLADRLAVVVAHCDAGAGNPASAAYLLVSEPGREASVADTLLEPDEAVLVGGISLRRGTVAMTGVGYTASDVPRCCPDRTVDAVWRWDGDRALRLR